MIKVVFFDIGNVLLRFSAREIAKKLAFGVRANPIKIARLLLSSELGDKVERGLLGSDALYELFQKELGFKGSFAAFRLLWCDHFTVDRESNAILRAVAERMPTYLLSNTNALHYEFIQKRYAFPRVVKGAILSYELQARKPEPEIYRAALKMAGVEPREAVFIDDLQKNVDGAKKVGLHAFRYVDGPRLRRDLKDLGVLQ
jgi:FMN phosphatase YigB (HAD superfamily)